MEKLEDLTPLGAVFLVSSLFCYELYFYQDVISSFLSFIKGIQCVLATGLKQFVYPDFTIQRKGNHFPYLLKTHICFPYVASQFWGRKHVNYELFISRTIVKNQVLFPTKLFLKFLDFQNSRYRPKIEKCLAIRILGLIRTCIQTLSGLQNNKTGLFFLCK